MRFEFFIASRYLRAKRKQVVISVITVISILGVMAAAGGRVWFTKLLGDADLAQREKPRFEAFVKSLALP